LRDFAGVSVWSWHPATNLVLHTGSGGLAQGVPIQQTLRQIHPRDRARVKRKLATAARTGGAGRFEFRSNPAGGNVHTLSATFFPGGGEGDENRVQILVQDITSARRAELALRESEDRYRTAVALNPEIPWVANAEGKLIEVGPRWVEIAGPADGRDYGQHWRDRLHPEDAPQVHAEWGKSVATGAPLDVEYRLLTISGEYIWMRARAAAARDSAGQIVRWYGTLANINMHRQALSALRDSEEFARSILESSTAAIEVLDAEGRLIFINGPGMALMEVDDFALIHHRPFASFWPQAVQPAIYNALASALQGHTVRQTLLGPTAKGQNRWWDISISPIRNADGQVERLLALSSDVSEAKRVELEIIYLARHDALTGLANRIHFYERIELALAALEPQQSIAVFSVDLDDFRLVNDTMGHPAGDALLREVATRLAACAGGTGFVGRLGGDEFALLFELDKPEESVLAAQAILATLARPFSIEGELVSIGASIGIAVAPRNGSNPEILMQCADVALYRVKAENGRNFRFFEPAMDLALKGRREMKRDLSRALERKELFVVYQPQIDIASNRLNGFEALLRWQHPARGAVSPADFIPLAEESGLIDEIGAFVLQEACAEAMHWPDTIRLAVNLSPAQFRSRAVNRTVAEALGKTGLPATRLELEITESVLLDESTEAIAALNALHASGIQVALDDFGTGYSSLSYLRRFPFDKIKIDRSFVSDLPGSGESAAIVRSIIGLGRSLKTRVTAEGVETWDQLLMLSSEGCDEAQGYLFSQPLPAAQARALAATRGMIARPSEVEETAPGARSGTDS
jgi:diguanylate cyclase (GGDEF)-like protein/PAS domain S-box-containing protein